MARFKICHVSSANSENFLPCICKGVMVRQMTRTLLSQLTGRCALRVPITVRASSRLRSELMQTAALCRAPASQMKWCRAQALGNRQLAGWQRRLSSAVDAKSCCQDAGITRQQASHAGDQKAHYGRTRLACWQIIARVGTARRGTELARIRREQESERRGGSRREWGKRATKHAGRKGGGELREGKSGRKE